MAADLYFSFFFTNAPRTSEKGEVGSATLPRPTTTHLPMLSQKRGWHRAKLWLLIFRAFIAQGGVLCQLAEHQVILCHNVL